VQARNTLTETRDLLATAASSDIIRGVVGWVDLADDVAEQVAGLRASLGGDRLVGIRHLVHRDPDPLWLARADVNEGLR
ncbi:amidohydrolase, partial [Vibrio parahaemolyticus]